MVSKEGNQSVIQVGWIFYHIVQADLKCVKSAHSSEKNRAQWVGEEDVWSHNKDFHPHMTFRGEKSK